MEKIASGADEHEFGVAMVEAGRKFFTLGAAKFAPAQREGVRAALAQGAALEVRIQLKPTELISAVLEGAAGEETVLFSLVPEAIAGDESTLDDDALH